MNIYLIIVYILFMLALVDLVVGVSNDAVNFLNSAIGSRVAPFRIILMVASAGIICGSAFSRGMMEVAQNGIFHPSFFTFDKIMIIFISAMITDVLLIDAFNNLELPTSTTVSIVFSLLGASAAIGLYITSSEGRGYFDVGHFINLGSALKIIIGIFLSVLLSFALATIVQFLVRAIFSFDIQRTLGRFGAAFGGMGISIIAYFLVLKEAQGSSVISEQLAVWLSDHSAVLLLALFTSATVALQFLMVRLGVNPLRVVVLFGTFSLAMAFAGNDLVNFIGVAVGGLSAYHHWQPAGATADGYYMEALPGKSMAPFWLLISAGWVMVVTIWTSAKSRKVTETEIFLGRQDEGEEKFKSNGLARVIVGTGIAISRILDVLFPAALRGRFHKQEAGNNSGKDHEHQASFDLVRASVNLLVSSALIAYGTSHKLPLSTTFVTFMVAMGSSFADRAWGRESAVYRVAGVIRVVAGWFTTAFIALVCSAITAIILVLTGFGGILIVTVFAVAVLVASHVNFNRKVKPHATLNGKLSVRFSKIEFHEMVENTESIAQLINAAIKSLTKENTKELKRIGKKMRLLDQHWHMADSRLVKTMRSVKSNERESLLTYSLLLDKTRQLNSCRESVRQLCKDYIINHHLPPDKPFLHGLHQIEESLMGTANRGRFRSSISDFDWLEQVSDTFEKVVLMADSILLEVIEGIQQGKIGARLGQFEIKLLLEIRSTLQKIVELFKVGRRLAIVYTRQLS